MKTFSKIFAYAAVAAFALSSCTSEKLKNDNLNEGKTVTVHFGAETTDPSSKATLTPRDEGENAFDAAWENEDKILISYSFNNQPPTPTTGTWNLDSKSFEAELFGGNGAWVYDAAYPEPEIGSRVDFGSNRTQKGNAYNSKYDIMIGSASANNAAAGQDDSGNDIIFKMDRQTAIAYFHFTSKLDEAITSATLTVSGDGAAIASSSAYVNNFVWEPTKDSQSIKITFPEEAPNAQDFKLWFNVLPTKYKTMSLTVETATKTFTISKSSEGTYEAGKLYKVKKEGISWETKPTTIFFYESFDKCENTGGNDGTWSDISSSGTIEADNTGWSFTKGNPAKNCARFGTGKDKGSATTPSLGITTSDATLWFMAGAWDGSSENKTISLSISGNGSIKPSSITLTKGAWTEYYCTISGADSNTKVIFEAVNTKNNRFFLDEVYVYSGPRPSKYSVNIESVEGGSLVASPTSAIEGKEITLTATPKDGYSFNNDWTVTNVETSKAITVQDGKFTMPAANVTVSASFTQTGAGAPVDSASYEWDLTTASNDWTNSGCETYFKQPYGIKTVNAYIVNKSIAAFTNATPSKISVSVKSLCNGATTSKLTVYLVNSNGDVVGEGKEIIPDNASSANNTTYKEVVFESSMSGATGIMVKCTTFGKNVLINGVKYTVTY